MPIMNQLNEIMDGLPTHHKKLLWDFIAAFTAMREVIEQFGLKEAVDDKLHTILEELGFVD